MTRRDVLAIMGSGFGMVGFKGVAAETPADPLRPKPPHFPAKAKRVIYLFLNGGPSQVDTFDPKPKLDEYNGKPIPSGNLRTERKTGNLLKSPFRFKKYGQSGIEISEIFPKLAGCADDLCVIRSMRGDHNENFPFVRRRGPITIIGLSTSLPPTRWSRPFSQEQIVRQGSTPITTSMPCSYWGHWRTGGNGCQEKRPWSARMISP